MKKTLHTQKITLTLSLILIALTGFVSTVRATDILKPGNLIVSTLSHDTWQQTLWAVDAVSGEKQQLTQLNVGSINDGIAITKEGRLFMAQDQEFRVIEINMQNGSFNVVAGNGLTSTDPNALLHLGNLHDMELADDNSLWILGRDYIYHLDPNTSIQLAKIDAWENPALQLHNPWGIGIEPNGSILKTYMSYIGDSDGGVVRVNPTTGTEQLVARLNNTYDVVNDGNGHIYALDYIANTSPDTQNIVSIDESTGATSVLKSGLPLIEGVSRITFSPGNGLYVNSGFTGGDIWHINPTTGDAEVLTTFSSMNPYSIVGLAVIPIPEPAFLILVATGIVCLFAYKQVNLK